MNSLPDNEFDKKLDQLLVESVSPGAEPTDFSVIRMPERPRFNRALLSGAVTGIALPGALLFVWILYVAAETSGTAVLRGDLWIMSSDSIIAGAESLSSPTVLAYVSMIMAGIYYFIGSRILRLYRLR